LRGRGKKTKRRRINSKKTPKNVVGGSKEKKAKNKPRNDQSRLWGWSLSKLRKRYTRGRSS